MERVEDVLSEWEAVCRVRCKGVPAIQAEALRLMDTSKELWRLKEAVPEMIWTLISPVLAQSTPDPQDLAKLKGEFDGCMRPENLQGIFPVGSPWSSAETVDLKFKPGLPALRFNHLLSTIIGPALKGSRTVEEANAQNSIQLWVPLPSAVLKKRKRRADADDGGKGGHPKGAGKGRGGGEGSADGGGGGGHGGGGHGGGGNGGGRRRGSRGRSRDRRRR